MKIYSYKFGSKSAKALAKSLGAKRIKHEGSKFKGRYYKKVVNWGASVVPPQVGLCDILNYPEAVAVASNKLSCFLKLSQELGVDAPIPTYTKNIEDAKKWVTGGSTVVCRSTLTGHSGAGIVVASHVDDLVPAPLYVKYVKKQQEYRIHVFDGEVLDVQRKARNKDVPDDKVNWQVRNHTNGFIFARGDANPDKGVLDAAVACVKALGLDFGAADVIWNEKEKKAYVLEVNTAPGLEGTTLDKYTKAIQERYNV